MNPTATLTRTLLLGALLCAAPYSFAVSKLELDARVKETLQKLYDRQSAARDLSQKAAGMLVFPRIIKGGAGIGAESGQGALLVRGNTSQYYRVTSLSFGFQLGGQAQSQVIMFMTEEALRNFMDSDGWEAGVDGSIAVVEFGAGKEFDSNSLRDPIIAFLFNNKGLMYNLSLEGSKYWKIDKK